MVSSNISVWIAALLTVFIYSFILYKDNPLFRFAERSIVATMTGYYFVMGVKNLLSLSINPAFQEQQWLMLIPFLIGLLLFARFFKQTEWASRWPVAILVGVQMAVAIVTSLSGKVMKLTVATMVPLNSFDNVVMFVLVIASLTYFLFSFKQEGILGKISKLGRYGLMITFGVTFGNYVMSRLTLVISRMQFLLFDFLGL